MHLYSYGIDLSFRNIRCIKIRCYLMIYYIKCIPLLYFAINCSHTIYYIQLVAYNNSYEGLSSIAN